MNERTDEIDLHDVARGKAVKLLSLVLDINACIFLASFAVYLILLIIEKVRKGSVSSFNDTDKILYICIATGLLYILASRSGRIASPAGASERSWNRFLLLPAATAVLAAVLTYRLMSSYGIYAVLVSIAAGILAGMAAYAGFTTTELDHHDHS